MYGLFINENINVANTPGMRLILCAAYIRETTVVFLFSVLLSERSPCLIFKVLFGWSGKKQGLLVCDGEDLITKNEITMVIRQVLFRQKRENGSGFAMCYVIS